MFLKYIFQKRFLFEEKCNASNSENGEELKESATLSEQSVLLIGQVFNSLA